MQKAQPFKSISILTTIIHDQPGCRVRLAPFSISAARPEKYSPVADIKNNPIRPAV